MKTTRNILYVILLSALCMAVSCVKKAPEYVPGETYPAAEAFFPNTVPVGTMDLDESQPIQVPVTRANTSSALSVPIVADVPAGFSVPSTVEFAAGSADATISISFDLTQLTRGEYYDISLTLGNDPNPYFFTKYDFTRYFSDWAPYAIGVYTSGFFSSPWTQVLHRRMGTQEYEFRGLYVEGYDYRFVRGENPEPDGTYTLTPVGSKNSSGYYPQETGYMHPTYGMVSTNTDADIAYTWYDPTGGAAGLGTFDFDRQYVVSAGSFGWLHDVYEITELL